MDYTRLVDTLQADGIDQSEEVFFYAVGSAVDEPHNEAFRRDWDHEVSFWRTQGYAARNAQTLAVRVLYIEGWRAEARAEGGNLLIYFIFAGEELGTWV
jgi:hypothetical protein